jgi:hypothetical protein
LKNSFFGNRTNFLQRVVDNTMAKAAPVYRERGCLRTESETRVDVYLNLINRPPARFGSQTSAARMALSPVGTVHRKARLDAFRRSDRQATEKASVDRSENRSNQEKEHTASLPLTSFIDPAFESYAFNSARNSQAVIF